MRVKVTLEVRVTEVDGGAKVEYRRNNEPWTDAGTVGPYPHLRSMTVPQDAVIDLPDLWRIDDAPPCPRCGRPMHKIEGVAGEFSWGHDCRP
jgi:hypothetical protein